MNNYLNYVIEANVGLLLLLACYKLLLSRETTFRLSRVLLLSGIAASLLFPLIHIDINGDAAPLSLERVIPSYWLPEVTVGPGLEAARSQASDLPLTFWKYVALIYGAGLTILLTVVMFQLTQLLRIIRGSETYTWQELRIAESHQNKPTFSFFHFVFIGKAHELSPEEKEQILLHESVHARQWHSFDILLVNLLKIIFWFNPFISTYKKIFIQLHEFEADARAVENSDVNKYCSLLAKVALQSADFKIANHFNHSLTVKRIEMMRTIKSNIKRWKLVALFAMLPALFFFIACQDQVGDDMMEIAQNSTHTLLVPDHIQKRYEQLRKDHPGKNYTLVELNETASQKLDVLRMKYGLPRSIEVFTTVDGKPSGAPVKGRSEEGLVVVGNRTAAALDGKENAFELALDQTGPAVEGQRTFAIVEFTEETSKIAEKVADASQQDKIYTVVAEQPEFPGGYDSMMAFLRNNIRYPLQARQQGIEGTVFVSFIVQKDGTISDAKVIRGISPEADAEAQRVVTLSPPWTPGRNNNEAVAVRFVLPIKFALQN